MRSGFTIDFASVAEKPKVNPLTELVSNQNSRAPLEENGCINRSAYRLYLLENFGLDPRYHTESTEYVLVLGSSGLIGSHLAETLRSKGYNVLEVLSRHHLDLRVKDSLEIFSGLNIKFVFFLAYEVGGAKFLQLPSLQQQIFNYNSLMMNNVFSFLLKHRIRYTFASSSLSADNSTYGFVKRVGENITLANSDIGRVVRFWNIYGFEVPGPKSHIVPDIAFQCVTKRKAVIMTDGLELRQFCHVIDVATNLISIMEHFEESPLTIDISDGKWISIRDAATAVSKASPGCVIEYGMKPAKVQKRHEPKLASEWHKKYFHLNYGLDRGAAQVVDAMGAFVMKSRSAPSVSIIINAGILDDEVADSVSAIKGQLDSFIKTLNPMTAEIRILASSITTAKSLDFDAIVRSDEGAIGDLIRSAKSDSILLMNAKTMPTIRHLLFFYHNLIRNMTFYGARRQKSAGWSSNETEIGLSPHFTFTSCAEASEAPKDLSFIAATKDTWNAIGVPPKEANIHEWLMRFLPGYNYIEFESAVWDWSNGEERSSFSQEKCCHAE